MGAPEALMEAPDRHVAIVGTRDASPYGIRVAERLAAACARAGLVVVSGLARGVDAAAHRAALLAGGQTIGVQGTGVDVPYPAGHRALHAALVDRGTVVSEVEPGSLAGPGCFPRRNRIIAALSRVTVVVEAGFKSGAINTATHALELGRTVAAVPGRIDEERSAGSNRLIRDGASVVADVDDLLMIYGISTTFHTLGGSGGQGGISQAVAGEVETDPGVLDPTSDASGAEAVDSGVVPFRLAAIHALDRELRGSGGPGWGGRGVNG